MRGSIPEFRSTGRLLENVYVLRRADLLEHLWTNAHGDLAEMRFAQQQHQRARLTDTAADGERDFVMDDRLMMRIAQQVHLPVIRSCFCSASAFHADAHGGKFVPAF